MQNNYNYNAEMLISLSYSLGSFYKESKIVQRIIFLFKFWLNYVHFTNLCFMSNSSRREV